MLGLGLGLRVRAKGLGLSIRVWRWFSLPEGNELSEKRVREVPLVKPSRPRFLREII